MLKLNKVQNQYSLTKFIYNVLQLKTEMLLF